MVKLVGKENPYSVLLFFLLRLCNFPSLFKITFRESFTLLDSGFTPLSSVSFSFSRPLSDACRKSCLGREEAGSGGMLRWWQRELWSSRNVGWQLKRRGIDPASLPGWVSADKEGQSRLSLEKLPKALCASAHGKQGLGARNYECCCMFCSFLVFPMEAGRVCVCVHAHHPWPPSVGDVTVKFLKVVM